MRQVLGPAVPGFLSAKGCKAAGVAEGAACTLSSFFTAGRDKLMFKFSLQRRMLPKELLGAGGSLTEGALVDKFCEGVPAARSHTRVPLRLAALLRCRADASLPCR